MSRFILVSACLAGVKCRYDGKSNKTKSIVDLVEEGRAIPVCPEILGGLQTPRNCCEIQLKENKECVITDKEEDTTSAYLLGAQKTLEIAKIVNADMAILQQRSPSCGCGKIYDGTFTRNLINGDGITAQLLKQNGITVCNDENFINYLED
ncbi:MAG: DUF523 domain-containing protein [Marinifilaceae bacterium]